MTSPIDALICTSLIKQFDETPVLRGVSLRVPQGAVVALLGPSGCGKTTTLRLIAGFDFPDSGEIIVNGRLVASDKVRIAAENRRIGMVFQEYALFPHRSALENVAFGLRGSTRDKQAFAADLLTRVGLESSGRRMPHELSGGQQQRVALARAIAPQPELLLLDEPFSNLDAGLRTQVRAEVGRTLRDAGITSIFVTHDQEEALSFADLVAVMLDGRMAQFGTPQEVYAQPVTRAVASFVGEANFIPGEADGEVVHCAFGTLRLKAPNRGHVDVLIRPEAIVVEDEGIAAQVTWREYYGYAQRLGLTLSDETTLVARAGADIGAAVGSTLYISIADPVCAYAHSLITDN